MQPDLLGTSSNLLIPGFAPFFSTVQRGCFRRLGGLLNWYVSGRRKNREKKNCRYVDSDIIRYLLEQVRFLFESLRRLTPNSGLDKHLQAFAERGVFRTSRQPFSPALRKLQSSKLGRWVCNQWNCEKERLRVHIIHDRALFFLIIAEVSRGKTLWKFQGHTNKRYLNVQRYSTHCGGRP